MVGGKEVSRPCIGSPPPRMTSPPLAVASSICSCTLSTASALISGPRCDAIVKAVADLHLADRGLQLFGEGVIDARLHVNPVGADAGLAVVAEFAQDRAFDGCIQIGVVKHDERRVAAQLHRAFHHLIGGLLQQDAAHFGRAGEGQLAHGGVFAEFLADGG